MRASVVILFGVLGCGRLDFDPVSDGLPVSHCSNVMRDADETGIDCGGACVLACRGDSCSSDAQCVTGRCTGRRCELADGPPHWLPGPALTTGRAYFRAASDASGAIYAVAGTTNLSGGGAPTALNTGESLAMGATSWQMLPPLATRRHRHSVAVVDNTLYVFGGRDQNNTLLDSIEAFAGAWSPRMAAPSGHAGIDASAGADHRLYIFDVGTTLIYSPQADTWTSIGPAPPARDSAAVARGSDDRLYVIGGNTSTQETEVVAALDTATLTWAPVASLAGPRSFPAAVAAPDGRIYTIGGTPDGGAGVAEVEVYTPGIDLWTPGVPLVQARFGLAAAVGGDGRIRAIGGADQSNVFSSVEVYGPVLVLSAGDGAPGDTVTVSAANFAASAAFSVRLGDVLVAAGTTDASGVATVSFVVPPAPAAMYDVVAADQRSQYPVRVPFRVR